MNKQKILDTTGNMQDLLIESLKDPQVAEAYLNVALEEYQEDGDAESFLIALRNIAKAEGGLSELSKKTNLNRQSLYQTLSKNGNPRLITLGKVLKALGYHLSIERIEGNA